MRNLILFALFTIGIISCKDHDSDPDVLPAATQNGSNTAGAVIDGKIWVATSEYINTTGGAGTYCEKINNYTYLQVDLRHLSNNSRIFLKIAAENFEINKTYILSEDVNLSDTNFAKYNDSNGKGYMTRPNSVYLAKVTITKLNLSQDRMVSGTFEIKAVSVDGSEINITEGRFDKKFD